jgi:hypothetical protein
MLELTITSFHLIQVLVVGSEVQLSTPLTKGKGWLLVGHICICLLISITCFYASKKRESTKSKEEWGGILLYVLEKDILWCMDIGQPYAYVDFNPTS